jgi:hypothetical protein
MHGFVEINSKITKLVESARRILGDLLFAEFLRIFRKG